MVLSGIAALCCTVALLVTTAYFLMGGLPLLILAHDTPVDQRFIRRFFDIYYQGALITATGAALSYLAWGRLAFAAGTAVIAALAIAMRRRLLPLMSQLSERIQARDLPAVAAFRRAHGAALLLNLLQLVALVWGVTQLSL